MLGSKLCYTSFWEQILDTKFFGGKIVEKTFLSVAVSKNFDTFMPTLIFKKKNENREVFFLFVLSFFSSQNISMD